MLFCHFNKTYFHDFLSPVVRSIVSLTSSLRGELVKCFMTLSPDTRRFLLSPLAGKRDIVVTILVWCICVCQCVHVSI